MAHVAFLFPGQGAQAVGMGKGFYDRFACARALYQQASRALGFDVAALCFEGPQAELTKTEKCQPALFVTSLAAHAALREADPSLAPIGVAGLSLGELTSLAAAEAMKLSEAFYLVQARAEAMAECTAHHGGAMLAVVGLNREAIEGVCRESGASAANYNAQDQLVLSGTLESITKAQELATAAGAKRAVPLDVAGAFHSPLMQPAAAKFKQAVSKVTFVTPRVPVISNVTARPVHEPSDIAEILVKQIVSPVLWEPSMRYLIQQGATRFLEFPPARVLTGLLRRIEPSVKGIPIDDPVDFDTLTT
jgi:[acyl-carrier-protein] S-malonyltransferase